MRNLLLIFPVATFARDGIGTWSATARVLHTDGRLAAGCRDFNGPFPQSLSMS